jgi:hypothetical protein
MPLNTACLVPRDQGEPNERPCTFSRAALAATRENLDFLLQCHEVAWKALKIGINNELFSPMLLPCVVV